VVLDMQNRKKRRRKEEQQLEEKRSSSSRTKDHCSRLQTAGGIRMMLRRTNDLK
jgi:hypothetical protein